jgi:lysozyme
MLRVLGFDARRAVGPINGISMQRMALAMLVAMLLPATSLEARELSLREKMAAKATPANPYPQKGDSDPHDGVTAARRHAIQGIDVSKWQGEIDWVRVKAAGTRFAFIKATEGGDLVDDRLRENWEGAKKAGVPRGAYHFVYWCRSAADQIKWFKRHIPKDADALPPVLDLEWNGHSRGCPRTLPKLKALAKIRTMLAALEAHTGKKPIIYTDITFHEDVFEGSSEFDNYPFWLRSVAAHPSERYEKREWEFWQFTATGKVPGVAGDVDRNAFFGTDKQFRDWVAGRYDIGARREISPSTPKLAKRDVNVTGSVKLLPAEAFEREPDDGE